MLKQATPSPTQRKQANRIQFYPAWMRLVFWLVMASSTLVSIYLRLVWPRISRWGATDEVVDKPLPGDELVPEPILVTTKAINIHAKSQDVWPWIAQLGVDRGGMYSYLWIENALLHLNVTNVETIHPEWQNLQVGDFIRFTPKDFALNPGPGLYVLIVDPYQTIAGCFGLEDEPADCDAAPTWQFILEPQGANATRLILRSRTPGTPTKAAILGSKIGYAFQFFMERKMLLGLKERAEAQAVPHIAPTIAQ